MSWGGETQALVYHPKLKKIIGINALGVAPTGATADFFLKRGMRYPPGEGPLSAVTPGTPGGLMLMLAEYGTMSLEERCWSLPFKWPRVTLLKREPLSG